MRTVYRQIGHDQVVDAQCKQFFCNFFQTKDKQRVDVGHHHDVLLRVAATDFGNEFETGFDVDAVFFNRMAAGFGDERTVGRGVRKRDLQLQNFAPCSDVGFGRAQTFRERGVAQNEVGH